MEGGIPTWARGGTKAQNRPELMRNFPQLTTRPLKFLAQFKRSAISRDFISDS